jgi:molybdenum cofactor synthesis domain-containing protein
MRNAGIIIIGNEIISGRTQDLNVRFIAQRLDQLGIELKEVRIIPDVEDVIIRTMNDLRVQYDYIFTTGGIGATHDDITARCVAKAFNVEIIQHPEIVALLQKRVPKAHEASYRMADVPKGASLIGNPVSQVPGFKMENVFVFAGVPAIMRGMFASIEDSLEKGTPTLSKTIDCHLTESSLANGLSSIQLKFQDVDIGSYPYQKETTEGYLYKPNHHPNWGVNVVLRSKEEEALHNAAHHVIELIRELGGEPVSL